MPTREEKLAFVERQKKIKFIEEKKAQQHADPLELSDSPGGITPPVDSTFQKAPEDRKGMGDAKFPAKNYIEEMHPDIKAIDRAIVKNLANNPAAAEQFLKQRYPEHEIVSDASGRVYIRSQAEKKSGQKARVLDPSGIPSSLKEAAMDVADLPYDVTRGIGTTLAGVAGATAAAAANPAAAPFTALPAGAAAAGAVGTGLDYARQWAGKLAGVPQDTSLADAAESGAYDAAGAALFGTGAGSAAMEKALVAKYGADEAKNIIKKYGKKLLTAGSGLPGKAWNAVQEYVTPKMGELASGVQSDLIRSARDNPEALKEFGRLSKTEQYSDITNRVKASASAMKQEILDAESAALDQMQGKVPVAPIKEELLKYKTKLDTLYKQTKSPIYQKQAGVVQGKIDEYFPKVEKLDLGLVGPTGQPIQSVVPPPSEIPLRAANDLKRRIQDDLDSFSSYNPNRLNQSGQSGTSVDNELAMAGKSVGTTINSLMDKSTDNATAKVRKQWQDHLTTTELFDKKFGSPEETEKTLLSLRGPKTKQLQEQVQAFDKKYGLDLTGTAKTAQAEKFFSNAPFLQQSAQGTTSTSRTGMLGGIGGALGYAAGANATDNTRGGGLLGAAAGAPLAVALGSPKMLMQYAKGGRLLEKALSPAAGESIPQSLYNLGLRKSYYDAVTPKDDQ